MTQEGRLARGKENVEFNKGQGRFLQNSETLEYIYNLPENIKKRKLEAEAKAKLEAEAKKAKENR